MLISSSVFVRDNLCRWALGIFSSLAIFTGFTQAQTNTGGFDPGIDGVIYASVVQSDGKILLGGAFASVRPNGAQPIGRLNLARYLPDGSLDMSFDPNLNGPVQTLALQADGSILVGGAFTALDPNRTGSPVDRVGIARLNANGTVDGGFNPNPSGEQAVNVFTVAVQDDGRIVFGGRFDAVQPGAVGAVVTRNFIARVNSNGSLDTAFDPEPNNIVYSLSTPGGGRVIAGGGFTKLQPNGGTEVIEVGRIARFNSDGSYDAGFNLWADDRVMAQIFEADGSMILGGDFLKIQQGPTGTAFDRLGLARIDPNGNVDASFRPNANAGVYALAIQRDGRIVVGGLFRSFTPAGSFGAMARNFLARINPDGSLDTTFGPEPNYVVHAIAIQANDSIIAGGSFTRYRPISFAGSIIRSGGARLYVDGSLDGSFSVDSGGEFAALTRLPDGDTLATGQFNSVGGVTRYNLVKLNPDGVVDEAFAPFTNDYIEGAVVDAEGRILIVGRFSQVNELSRPGIARLNADGTLDESFYPYPNAPIISVSLQSDGKIMVGGSFTGFNPNEDETGVGRSYLARLNTDGTVDESYSPAMGGPIEVVYVQSDGKTLVGGQFLQIRAQGAEVNSGLKYLVRFNPNGTLDEGFVPEPNDVVDRIAVQSDGKIVVAGLFTQFNPGKTEEAVERQYLARLGADGTVDEGFDPNPDGGVSAVFLDSTGRILIGGVFKSLTPHKIGDPIYRERFARLNPDGSVDASLIASANDEVQSFVASGDAVLIGGRFTTLQSSTGDLSTTSGRVARLNTDSNLDPTYAVRSGNPDDSRVAALAPQYDGTILVGGNFSELGGGINRNLARLFSDGNIDFSFSSRVNGPVNAMLSLPDIEPEEAGNPLLGILTQNGAYVDLDNPADGSLLQGDIRVIVEQGDGKLLVGGNFSDGNLVIGPYLARFNTDGSLDVSFAPFLNGSVSALAIQTDGKLLIGGLFTEVDGVVRNRIARLNTDGSLDDTFDPNADSEVLEIVIQTDGRILVGGSFSSFTPNGGEGVARGRLARLLATGVVDPDFTPSPNSRVIAIALEADGKILIGGEFESIATLDGTIHARERIARLAADGAVDEVFIPSINGSVLDLNVAPDGRILVAGSFTAVYPVGAEVFTVRRYIARFNADGTIDPGYDPNANASISSLYRLADQKMLVGGSFTSFRPNDATYAVVRNRVARLTVNGVPDINFSPHADDLVKAVLGRADGTIAVGGAFTTLLSKSNIFIGGNFSTVNDAQVRNLARLDENGSPDNGFKPDPDRPVDGLVFQPDGSVIVVGQFSQIAGELRNRIARFKESGELDADFDPDSNGVVSAAVLQADGKIVIGGSFTTIGGVVRRRLARLNSDGSLDAGFVADVDGPVTALAVRTDGTLLVGGSYATIGGIPRANLALLTADGSVVSSFNPAPDGPVRAIAVQTDGAVMLGGAFSTIAGGSRANVAKLTATGSLDDGFNVSVNGEVLSVILLETGRSFLGGDFTQVGGEARLLTVRLAPTTVALDRIEVDSALTQVTWFRQGALPEISAAYFSTSADGLDWVFHGGGTRVSGTSNWQFDLTQTLPATEYYYVRTEGIEPTTGQSSSGSIRSVSRFYGSTPAGPSSVGQDPQMSDASDQNGDSNGSDGSSSGSEPTGDSDQDGSSGSSGSTGAGFAWDELPETDLVAFTNLSARVKLGVNNAFITGFSITGPATKPVLLRAVGPGLSTFGVDDHAPAPQLEVFDAAGHLVASSGAWNGDPVLSEQFATVGAFPLAASSADAALRVDLDPGAYTVRVSESSGLPGVALAEIYDLEVDPGEGRSRLVNISSRGPVSIGSGVATGGFHLAGDRPAALLVRAVGPGLNQFGVADAIADPVVMVRDFAGNLLAENDDWASPLLADDAHPAYAPAEMVEAAIRSGAFSLDAGSSDGVVLIELEPGTYTVQARSEDGTEGETIIEIYLVQ